MRALGLLSLGAAWSQVWGTPQEKLPQRRDQEQNPGPENGTEGGRAHWTPVLVPSCPGLAPLVLWGHSQGPLQPDLRPVSRTLGLALIATH